MLTVVTRRVSQLIPTALFASVLGFLLLRIVPGGPAQSVLGIEATPESLKTLDRTMGLDHPLYYQYWHWITGVVRGNFGTSLVNGQSVSSQLVSRLPISGELVGLAVLLTVLVAVPIGVTAATHYGRRADNVLRQASGIGLAIPDFFLAILLIDVFAVELKALPELGFEPLSQSVSGNLRDMVLPVLTLAAGAGAIVVRQVRAVMVDSLGSDHVRTARAMGLSERQVVRRYAFRNALPIILNVYGLLIIGMFGATIILEEIFDLPGLGTLLIYAIENRDYTVLQGTVMVYVGIVMVVNLLVDVLSAAVNPRLRVRA
jgi:peptide/nickel transport system permease protein